MEGLAVFATVCLLFGGVVLARLIWAARDSEVGAIRRILGAALYLALACFLLSMGCGAIALMNHWRVATNALEGVAVISGSLTLLLPLVITVGAGARAVVRRVTRPTRG